MAQTMDKTVDSSKARNENYLTTIKQSEKYTTLDDDEDEVDKVNTKDGVEK